MRMVNRNINRKLPLQGETSFEIQELSKPSKKNLFFFFLTFWRSPNTAFFSNSDTHIDTQKVYGNTYERAKFSLSNLLFY